MIAVGVVLLLIAALIAVVLVTNGGQSVSMNFVGVSLNTNASWFFVAGVVAAVLALGGLWLLRFGARRSLRMRKKNRALRKEAEASRGPDGPDGDADTHFDSAPRE